MARPLPEQLLALSPLWASCDGGTLIVAVSGGRDSVALARAAATLLADAEFRRRLTDPPELVLWHLDHGLRPESPADAVFVQQLSFELGCRAIIERCAVRSLAAEQSANIEAVARHERYHRLARMLEAGPDDEGTRQPAVAATAHHLGDQAETILFNLVRGTHLSGLRGIAPRYMERIHRPWLALPPEEIERYLRELGQDWREDATNADVSLARNRIRHHVLPELQAVNPRAREHIAGLARMAVAAEAELAGRLATMQVRQIGTAELSAWHPLLALPHAAVSLHVPASEWPDSALLIAYCTQLLQDRLGALSQDEHWQVTDWAESARRTLTIRGWAVARLAADMLIAEQQSAAAVVAEPVRIPAPGEFRAGLLHGTLRTTTAAEFEQHRSSPRAALEKIASWPDAASRHIAGGHASPVWQCFLPQPDLPELTLRTPREGDKLTLPSGGTKKLGDVFTDAKVPVALRHVWAVVEDSAGCIVWVPGLADTQLMLAQDGELPRLLLQLTAGR